MVFYEFRLQQGSVPQMLARITKHLKPAYMQTRAFQEESEYMQNTLIRHTTRACEYKSFSAVRVKTLSDIVHGSKLDEGNLVLCFAHTNHGTETVEIAEEWTRCTEPVLAKLREGLQTVFGMQLGRVH